MPAKEPPAAISRGSLARRLPENPGGWLSAFFDPPVVWSFTSATSRRGSIPASRALTFLCSGALFRKLEAHAGALDDHRLTAPSLPGRRDQHRRDAREWNGKKCADDSAEVCAYDDCQQRGHRMQANRSAGDSRRWHVVLDHLHHDEKDDHVDHERKRLREADRHGRK